MYAIISDSGRQFTVREGDVLTVDYRDAAIGSSVRFDKVLLVSADSGVRVGSPTLPGVAVTAEVVGPEKGPKLVVQKFRRRKNSRRRTGHRQIFTQVRIEKIQG